MKIKEEDREMLKELCRQYQVSDEKVLRLLETIREYEFKDRRTGVYDALTEIIKTDLKP